MIISFGRCNLPHNGHVSLINSTDLFIMSDGRKCVSAGLRLEMLFELGADTDKIVVANPYKFLSRVDTAVRTKIQIICERDNEHLPAYLGFEVIRLEKRFGISSTMLRKDEKLLYDYYGKYSLQLLGKALKCKNDHELLMKNS